jgi:beta-glucosidase-like glycosyl hydrolase
MTRSDASPPLPLGRLILPALRWDAQHGFASSRAAIDHALELGVGGFILFGGTADGVRELTTELHRRSAHPLLVASDLERGAGQQFRGETPLPPAAALASLDDPATTRRAAEITAREARAVGVNWIYAPVADIDIEADNPIIGTRAFGTTAGQVSAQVAAWTEGCRAGGALSCAKHFPGHGRTIGDSHIEQPCVMASRAELELDLEPFRAAIGAGVDSMMTAHVCYPALDPAGLPATLSPRMLGGLLREELGFEGLVVTDALIMEGLVEGTTEADAAVHALAAGCDVLLYPDDAGAVIAAVTAALHDGRLSESRLRDALERIGAAAARVAGGPAGEVGRDEDRRWALETATRTLRVMRGEPALPRGQRVRLVQIDDDVGGPFPPYPREALPRALREAGLELDDDAGEPLIVLYSDIRAWKGRPGISERAQAEVRAVTDAHPDATLLLFSHPRLEHEVSSARHVLAAWGGEGLMQQAAVGWLTGRHGGLAGAEGGLDR